MTKYNSAFDIPFEDWVEITGSPDQASYVKWQLSLDADWQPSKWEVFYALNTAQEPKAAGVEVVWGTDAIAMWASGGAGKKWLVGTPRGYFVSSRAPSDEEIHKSWFGRRYMWSLHNLSYSLEDLKEVLPGFLSDTSIIKVAAITSFNARLSDQLRMISETTIWPFYRRFDYFWVLDRPDANADHLRLAWSDYAGDFIISSLRKMEETHLYEQLKASEPCDACQTAMEQCPCNTQRCASGCTATCAVHREVSV